MNYEQLNSNLTNFKTYFLITQNEDLDINTNDWYKTLPNDINFELLLQVVGTLYRVSGYKVNANYGYMRLESYTEHNNIKERKLDGGAWSAWTPYVTTNDITSDFTVAVVQDLNSPTMAIHSYLNNANNPPNGYQTGGKVVSVIDSNGELGAQLSLTRGYSHPQYRYKDNNGWSAWNNILLESDQKTIQVGSDHAVTDCNNVMPGQMAYVYANAAHAPSGNKSWNVWCTGLDAFRMQIAINVTTNVPIMMIRSSHTGVWSDWVEK